MSAPDPIASRDLRTPNEFLSGDDVLGREVTLTIAKVEKDPRVPDPMNGKATTKPVVVFSEKWTHGNGQGRPIRVVINKSRLQQLVNLLGQDWSKWAGNKVTVFCDGQNGGKGSPRLAPNRSRMVAFKGAK